MTETERQVFQWGKGPVFFYKRKRQAAFATIAANYRENKEDV